MRTLLPITTLLLAAVVDAQPAPTAAPAAGSSATHEVRDRVSGEVTACTCRTNDLGSMVCDQCAPAPQPSIRITGQGRYVEASDFWSDVSNRLRGDPKVRAVLGDLEIRLDGWRLEFVIACRHAPDDRQYVQPGISMPTEPGSLMRVIRSHVERTCTSTPARAEPTSETTMWAGCPAQDDYDRGGFNRTANPKIRIIALPDSHRGSWHKLRMDLIFDDLLYHCSNELLIDPVSASGVDETAKFRATVTLICANDPKRRGEFDTGVAKLGAGAFRRLIGQRLRRICRLNATTTASRSAR